MGVSGIILTGHRRERVTQMTGIWRKAPVIAPAGVVVQTPVMTVAGDSALLLEFHQAFDLFRLGVGASAVAGAVGASGQFAEV